MYVGDQIDDKPHKRNSVRLAIRKIMYAPSKVGEQPSIEVSKEFMMKPNKIHLEASLDKELYHHGETISVNVHIANNSNRTVKKIKVSVRQFADICLFSTAQYKCTVAEIESDDSVGPGFTLSKVLTLRPLLKDNKDKRGLALDGQLKHDDSNLASSTIITDPAHRENLGIIVQYKVKVKLCIGGPILGGDLVAELPFTLMHPEPIDDEPSFVLPDRATNRTNANLQATQKDEHNESSTSGNLIQLEDDDFKDDDQDDIIFEDFARLRLKGEAD